jgi:hypothetical protein
MTPTQSATQVQEPADLYFTESPVLFPNPSLNGAFNVRYTASKTADFCMKIYTMGYRRVREITKKGLPPSQNIITADIGATGNMAAGIYYYVITLKGRDNETLFTKPSHFIIIK